MRVSHLLRCASISGTIGLLLATVAGCGSGVAGRLATDNTLFASVTKSSVPGEFFNPLSAVPDATDTSIYFTASGEHGRGVFRVPATRLSHNELRAGPPFVEPIDLVLSTNGQTIYVADRLAGGSGKLFAMPIGGGTPVEVPGTAGTRPVAIDIRNENGEDRLFFAGVNPSNGAQAAFEIPATGGEANRSIIHQGSPFIELQGLTVTLSGDLLAADAGTLQNGIRQSIIHNIPRGRAAGRAPTVIASGFIAGSPAGIVVTPDGKSAVVSSLSSTNRTSQVLVVDLATGKKRVFNKTIGANRAAGGLHGAKNANGLTGTYAWADLTGDGGGGAVYRLR